MNRPTETIVVERGATLAEEPDLPPVVARLVVEIRSDGTRTIARGAMEDHITGEKVGLSVHGTSPALLAKELAKSILQLPLLKRPTLADWLPERVRKRLGR